MFSNYIKFIIRVILRDRFHSFLNILGLSIGFASAIIVILFLQNELSYDAFHPKSDQLYRYGVDMTIGDVNTSQSTCYIGAGQLLKEHITGIDNYCRVGYYGNLVIHNKETGLRETGVAWADSSFFNMFNFELLYGNKNTCLVEPKTVVITESLAKNIFNTILVLGKTVEVEGYGFCTITGVMKDLPENTHFSFDALFSIATIYAENDIGDLVNARRLSSRMSYEHYFLFKNGYTKEMFYKDHQVFYDENFKEFDGINYKPIVEKITDIHLNSSIKPQNSEYYKRFLFGILSIGIFILVLASINYINMATSRFTIRTREIGLKKVIGASRNQLIFQFLGESLIVSLIAYFIALAIAEIVIEFTPFCDLIDVQLEVNFFNNSLLALGSIGLTFLIGLLSGIYPAVYQSNLSPMSAFRSQRKSRKSKFNLRNLLVLTQFIISIGAVTLTIFINSQIEFMRNKDLGFTKDNIIVFDVNDKHIQDKVKVIKNELENYHGIRSVSLTRSSPGFNVSGMAFNWENNNNEMEFHAFAQMVIDKDFFETYEIDFVEGENFYRDRLPEDTTVDVIVNEQLVTFLSWDEPIGKKFQFGKVIGVVKNFNHSPLSHEIRPTFMYQFASMPALLNVRIGEKNLSETINFIEKKFKEVAPNYAFEYTFLNQRLDTWYQSDRQQKNFNLIFSYICVIISIIGLLGLTSFITVQRTKEVAVRKVHGASNFDIWNSLFKVIFILLLIATILAIPVDLLVFNKWLENYAYKVNINYMFFLYSGLGAILVAILTSGYHIIKIIRANPIDSLRYE
jgi:putative ABC transport system permease protein